MQIRQIKKSEWRKYFDHVSRHLPTTQAEIEIAGLDVGDQIQTQWVSLLGITYDEQADVLEVATEPVDHRIEHPTAIHVEDEGGRLHMLRVLDDAQREQIVRLRTPLQIAK